MYKDLNRIEKRELREQFNKTKKGIAVLAPLNRLLFEGMFCIISSIIVVIAIVFFDLSKWYGITAIGIFLFGIFFLIGQHIIRIRSYNNYCDYLNKNKSNRKNKKK